MPRSWNRNLESGLGSTCAPQIVVAKLLITNYLAFHTHRLLCKRRQTDAMSEPFIRIMHVVIADRGVARHSVVPDAHGTIIPLHTDLQIGRDGDVLESNSPSVLCYHESEFWNRTLNKSWRSASDSSSFKPIMRRVKPGLMYKAFSPVA